MSPPRPLQGCSPPVPPSLHLTLRRPTTCRLPPSPVQQSQHRHEPAATARPREARTSSVRPFCNSHTGLSGQNNLNSTT
eukprot:scaffold236_cov419-Prasinococcus_capsulatus_cf.AAC.18